MIHMSADVYCHWSEVPPYYRIYVDNDMLTERTFIWPGYQNFIREHVICKLMPGVHTIRVENCSPNGKFTLNNFIIEGNTKDRQPGDTETQFTFEI